jgi:opacity protein-like surface antigen
LLLPGLSQQTEGLNITSKPFKKLKRMTTMKKLTILIAISFLFTGMILCQDPKMGLSITFKGGLTLANQYGKDTESETFLNGDSGSFYANQPASNKLKSGINIGSLLEYRFNNRYSLGLGINYIEKGSKINADKHFNRTTQSYESVNGTVNWIQNYWTVDLPLKVYFPIKQNEFNLLGGFTYGHLSNSTEKGEIEISGSNFEYTRDRWANKNEIGFLLGCGYNYLIAKTNSNLIIEFIWNRSFNKSIGADFIPNPLKYYNQTFNISLGYKFSLLSRSAG